MAEALFVSKAKAAGIADQIYVDSAGTGSWHIGAPPHQEACAILAKNKISWDHKARTINKTDLVDFDYVVTMDEDNLRAVRYLGPSNAKIVRFMDYAKSLGVREVPGPWFDGRFQYVYDLIDHACDGLLDSIKVEYFAEGHTSG